MMPVTLDTHGEFASEGLSHVSNYVSTDIIRRILQGYFGYKVNFVQNVTDIDDKVNQL
jgi:cysteinyl-tRNA synthetase